MGAACEKRHVFARLGKLGAEITARAAGADNHQPHDVPFFDSTREWERIFQKKASRIAGGIECEVKWKKVQFSDASMLLYMLHRRQWAGYLLRPVERRHARRNA